MPYQYEMEKDFFANWLVSMDVANVFDLWYSEYVTVGSRRYGQHPQCAIYRTNGIVWHEKKYIPPPNRRNKTTYWERIFRWNTNESNSDSGLWCCAEIPSALHSCDKQSPIEQPAVEVSVRRHPFLGYCNTLNWRTPLRQWIAVGRRHVQLPKVTKLTQTARLSSSLDEHGSN